MNQNIFKTNENKLFLDSELIKIKLRTIKV
jgi:hypothetical protein